jgi:hypothetical protein
MSLYDIFSFHHPVRDPPVLIPLVDEAQSDELNGELILE